MDYRMERISEVTEPDNLDVLSDKNSKHRTVSKVTEFPKLQENVTYVEKSNQARRYKEKQEKQMNGKVRKTRSTPNVLSGNPLSYLNVNGTNAVLVETPRGSTSKHSKAVSHKTENKVENREKETNPRQDNGKQFLKPPSNKVLSKSLEDVREVGENGVHRTNTGTVFNSSKIPNLKGRIKNGTYVVPRSSKDKEHVEW